MAAGVVALPEPTETVLAADVPYFEVDGRVGRWKGDGSHILSDSGDSFQVRVRRRIRSFNLLKESRFAGVIKAK